jgi:hypothetical protein
MGIKLEKCFFTENPYNFFSDYNKAYGFKYFDLLNNMEKSSMLFLQGAKNFNTICQKMSLIVDNVNEENPNDISYVFSGYAPLLVRFCQFLTRPNWKAYGDLFGLLPGQFFEETQRLPSGVRKRSNYSNFKFFVSSAN